MEKIRSGSENVFSFDEVRVLFPNDWSGADTRLVLAWLEIERKACISGQSDRIDLVKFAIQPGSIVGRLSEADLARHSLIKSCRLLTSHLQSLEIKKEQALLDAKKHIKAGLKQSVSSLLMTFYSEKRIIMV